MAKLNPYLNFKHNAREAGEFYKSVFGGKLTVSTFGESGMEVQEDEKNLVMHSELDTDAGFTLMASDTPSHIKPAEGKIGTISISGEEESEIKSYWDKLAEGANVTMPLNKAPWGDTFGMLTDKFGVEWMVNIAGKKA